MHRRDIQLEGWVDLDACLVNDDRDVFPLALHLGLLVQEERV